MAKREDVVRLTVRLPRDLVRQLKIETARRELNIQTAVEGAVRAWIKAKGER